MTSMSPGLQTLMVFPVVGSVIVLVVCVVGFLHIAVGAKSGLGEVLVTLVISH